MSKTQRHMSEPRVIAIACIRDFDLAIGGNGDLLFNIKEDMQFFKTQTVGHTVVMGRKNWDSLPHKSRPLSGRKNVVISRNLDLEVPDNVRVFSSLESALTLLRGEDQNIFIIGGGEIYQQALNQQLVDEVLVTVVSDGGRLPKADVFFHTNNEWMKDFPVMTTVRQPALVKDRKSGSEVVMGIFRYTKK